MLRTKHPSSVQRVPSAVPATLFLEKAADDLNKLQQSIVTHAKLLVVDVIRAGEILTKVKDELGHGNWLPWLKENVSFSDQTARNYMRVYQNRDDPKFKTVLDSKDFSLKDLYQLMCEPAKPKVPAFNMDLLPPHDMSKSKLWDRSAPLCSEEILKLIAAPLCGKATLLTSGPAADKQVKLINGFVKSLEQMGHVLRGRGRADLLECVQKLLQYFAWVSLGLDPKKAPQATPLPACKENTQKTDGYGASIAPVAIG